MTYEEVREGIECIDEDYQNLSLSRFDFPQYLHKNKFWIGTAEEFSKVDKKMSVRMETNNVSFIVISTIETSTN